MKQKHIIQKVLIEVTVQNKEKAYMIKDNINSFLTVDIFPKIEKYLDTLEDKLPDHILQISHLKLDLNESEATLNTTLKNNIITRFKEELSEVIKPILKPDYSNENDTQVNLLSEQDKLLQTFIYFLEKGYMPWWNSNKNAINILENGVFKKIISAKAFENKIVSVIQKPRVLERIINQLTNTQIKQICLVIIKNKSLKIDLETNAIKELSKLTLTNRNTLWSLVLNILKEYLNYSNDNLEEYSLQQIIKIIPFLKTTQNGNDEEYIWKEIIKIFPFINQNQDIIGAKKNQEQSVINIKNNYSKKNQEQDIITVKNKSQKKDQEKFQQFMQTDSFSSDEKDMHNDNFVDENNGYYVQNAGLVLIHPFMKNLFIYCNLIDAKTQKLINPELCIHLLHYIATGKTNQPESDMLFEKFLCNIPLQQSISRHVKLSKKHKTHAKKVIEAIQQNWSAMKISSPELIQHEFLQRSGKLVLDNDNYTLTIERKTQDILLDKISWGISFIKLPWQDQFIYVNW